MTFSTGMALVSDVAPAHRLGQAIGLAGAASLVMNAIAPAIGEPIQARFGFGPVALLAGLAAAAAAAWTLPFARHRVDAGAGTGGERVTTGP